MFNITATPAEKKFENTLLVIVKVGKIIVHAKFYMQNFTIKIEV